MIAIEWTDHSGKHHFKMLSAFAAQKYIAMLINQGIKVNAHAAQYS
jgi:uncharacterized membrane protein